MSRDEDNETVQAPGHSNDADGRSVQRTREPGDADVTVLLPTLLAERCGGRRKFRVRGGDLRSVLEDVFHQAPGLKVHVLDESGHIRRHVLCYVGDKDSRWLDGLDTPVPPASQVSVVQAVSGG